MSFTMALPAPTADLFSFVSCLCFQITWIDPVLKKQHKPEARII